MNPSRDSKPVIMLSDEHLIKFVKLPFHLIGRSSMLPILNNLIYLPSSEIVSYSEHGETTGREIFGIGTVDLDSDFAAKTYSLPIVFPSEKAASVWSSVRRFSFAARSGSDLIYYLRGPLKRECCGSHERYFHNHFLYAFDTKDRKWSRILSANPDGTYHKQLLSMSGNIGTFSIDPGNAVASEYGELIVWSEHPGKIGIGLNDMPDEDADMVSARVENYISRQYDANEKYDVFTYRKEKNIFFFHPPGSSINGKTLELESSVACYRIFGISKVLEERSSLFRSCDKQKISLYCEESFLFSSDSFRNLGIFVNCFLPREWCKSVLLVFRCDQERTPWPDSHFIPGIGFYGDCK